jgi:hypothetical protein
VQVGIFQALPQCELYLPDKSGIANNYVLDNNTMYGIS